MAFSQPTVIRVTNALLEQLPPSLLVATTPITVALAPSDWAVVLAALGSFTAVAPRR
jgi:hypothetical protein